jgi:hypothetical protein
VVARSEKFETPVNSAIPTPGTIPSLPALTDELERVRLDIDIARREASIAAVRARITAEESEQQRIRRQIDDRIGELRREDERLTAEVARLDHRLERLTYSRRALSDRELDDEEHVERAEEAAFWAEWRQQREERRGTVINHRPNGDAHISLRQLYLALARLIHPDLARDSGDRARREAVMRLANEAHEAKDAEGLRRLLLIWSRPDEGAFVRDVGALRARLAERDIECGELNRQLKALEENTLGKLRRRPAAELERHITREEERLRREVATLRLRRRRLLSSLDERRRELTQVSD